MQKTVFLMEISVVLRVWRRFKALSILMQRNNFFSNNFFSSRNVVVAGNLRKVLVPFIGIKESLFSKGVKTKRTPGAG